MPRSLRGEVKMGLTFGDPYAAPPKSKLSNVFSSTMYAWLQVYGVHMCP